MTKERVWSYARELAYIIKQVRDAQAAIDAMTSEINIAKALNEAKRGEEVITARATTRTQLETLIQLACDKANKKDMAGCEKLLQQLQTRLEHLDEYERDVNDYESRFELAATAGEFATTEDAGTTRKQAEAMMDKARKRAAAQLELCDALVPNKAILLDTK